jgi:hypothetical protein
LGASVEQGIESYKIRWVETGSLIPYARNARTHSENQVAQIAASIREFGWTNPILTDEDGGIIAGHGRVLAARLLGNGMVPTIPLVGLTEAQKRAYIIADNKLALNAGWDDELLRIELLDLEEAGFDLTLTGFDGDELVVMLGEEPEGGRKGEPDPDFYSTKIKSPVYTPKGDQPALEELTDSSVADKLLGEIEALDLDESEKAFLRAAAARHVVFDYHLIAEYYCHASPAMQAAMEASALVVIDVDQAIERGYVDMTKKLDGIFTATADVLDDEV